MSPTADETLQPRSVGLVSPGWPPEALANGIVSYVGTIRAALAQQKVEGDVLTSRPLGTIEDSKVHIVRPDITSLYSKLMWRLSPASWENRSFCNALLQDVKRLHQERGLQLLEIEESYGWARYLWGRCPVPVIVRLHGPWFLNGIANGVAQDRKFQQRDHWEKLGLLCADGITAPSKHVLEQTRQHFGFALPDAQVIANPVETVASADRWNLQDCDRSRIVFVGRFDRHKGGDTMILAFARVLAQWPEARLDFIGPDRGLMGDSGRSWKFDEFVRANLSDAERSRITYHGFLPAIEAARLRKRALITVAPSRYETFGIATAEAMMAGCPVVACGAGALTELIQDGQNGLLARVADATDLADQLVSLLKNPERAGQLGKQAAIDAEERYSPEVIARQTIEFYRRALSRVPAKAVPTTVPSPHGPASVSA
jgi:glycosyltransferase involved in cell wall biosynthesis